jgi:hypothetical protein
MASKRFFFVITNHAQLQLALGELLDAGLDAKAANWNPDVVTNPPARAGVTVPEAQKDEASEILTGINISFVPFGRSCNAMNASTDKTGPDAS